MGTKNTKKRKVAYKRESRVEEDRGQVPNVRHPTCEVVAIVGSDLHLSHTPPIFRSTEPNWYKAMARPLKEINNLIEKYGCPFICPGDIFDTWRVPAELITFAFRYLPWHTYAVPGQHDLPFHNYADRKRSPYYTLVQAKHVIDVEPGYPITTPTSVIIHGFPWEHTIVKCPTKAHTFGLNVAAIHSYIWTRKTKFPGAPVEQRLREYQKKLVGYECAFFGDNHRGFLAKGKGSDCHILNCGSMMIRNSDQYSYKPSVGLLYADGNIERHFLDTSKDKYLLLDEIPEIKEKNLELESYISFMTNLEISPKAFKDSVIAWMKVNKISDEVRKIVLDAVEISIDPMNQKTGFILKGFE